MEGGSLEHQRFAHPVDGFEFLRRRGCHLAALLLTILARVEAAFSFIGVRRIPAGDRHYTQHTPSGRQRKTATVRRDSTTEV